MLLESPDANENPWVSLARRRTVKMGLHCFLDGPKSRKKVKSVSGATGASQGTQTASEITSSPITAESVKTSVSNSQPEAAAPKRRNCWACGANLVDWNRVHMLKFDDAAYTLKCLKFEFIRHHFWHVDIDQWGINYALRKGLNKLRPAAEKRVRKAVGVGVHPGELTFDGRQTPTQGNVIFYAQHATATCCRKCMEVWHGIPRTDDLTEEHIEYFTDLIMLFVRDRLPLLGEDGIKVPPIRKPKDEPGRPELTDTLLLLGETE